MRRGHDLLGPAYHDRILARLAVVVAVGVEASLLIGLFPSFLHRFLGFCPVFSMTISRRMTQPSFRVPNITSGKRMMNSDVEMLSSPHKKKKRTSEDFLEFCSMVLNYTQYNTESTEIMREEYNGSPLDSTGTIDSSDSYSSDVSQLYNIDHDHNSSFDEEDSMDLVTCFCLKPYAGRPMIECSECNLWIHLSCAKIRKTNIPETFTCQKCRDSHLKTRKSARTRVENKRVTL